MTLRHSCQTHGCYIKNQTPDWGFADNAFSGRIKIGDIDGIVEVNGHILILEWKGGEAKVPPGQDIMFKKASQHSYITVFVINGDALTTQATNLIRYFNGNKTDIGPVDNNEIFNRCANWEKWARKNNIETIKRVA